MGTKPIEVSAGLVFRDGKVLITRRRDDTHLGGLWEFPGGKRRPNESFEECLKRELREELGIEVEVEELIEEITHTYPEQTVHLRFYRCAWRQHEPQRIGCADFVWAAQSQLMQYPFPEADARLLGKLTGSPEWWR